MTGWEAVKSWQLPGERWVLKKTAMLFESKTRQQTGSATEVSEQLGHSKWAGFRDWGWISRVLLRILAGVGKILRRRRDVTFFFELELRKSGRLKGWSSNYIRDGWLEKGINLIKEIVIPLLPQHVFRWVRWLTGLDGLTLKKGKNNMRCSDLWGQMRKSCLYLGIW